MHIFLSDLAQTVGTILFVGAFLLVLAYALSPHNRRIFDRAASVPLDDDDEDQKEKSDD
jgi:cbb3-type cytochrome oxidase subunit 3